MEFVDACKNGDVETVKNMLSNCNIDLIFEDCLALRCAFDHHRHDVIDLLLQDKRLNPKGEDGFGFYYLTYDNIPGFCEIVKIKLDDNSIWYCFAYNGKIIKRDGKDDSNRLRDDELEKKYSQWKNEKK